ncbi:MAG: chemotaxis protein CheW [Betaproteobacteria bacterium]|nr:chemotaxis protein CheW [Betaproteobacteria bacterium]
MAKRISLREFQQQLVSRMSSVQRGEAPTALLGVQAGTDFWLLDLADSEEITSVPGLTPVPLAQPWFLGLANIRGKLYSVVDLAAFTSGVATPPATTNRLLLLNGRFGMNCGLIVNRTLGLKNPEDLRPDDAPPTGPVWVGECFRDAEDRRWRRLHIKNLVTQPKFLDVGV